MNDQKVLLTTQLNKCNSCSDERKNNVQRELQAVERSLQIDLKTLTEQVRPLKERIKKLYSNLSQNLIDKNYENSNKLTENLKHETQRAQEFFDYFKNNKLWQTYFNNRSLIERKSQEIVTNLDENFKFNSIKPDNKNILYKTTPSELEGSKFIEHFLKSTNGKEYSKDDDDPLTWIEMDEKADVVPENGVLAGEDVDGSKLYVMRTLWNGAYVYGKYAHSHERKNAYIPDYFVEIGQEAFVLG